MTEAIKPEISQHCKHISVEISNAIFFMIWELFRTLTIPPFASFLNCDNAKT